MSVATPAVVRSGLRLTGALAVVLLLCGVVVNLLLEHLPPPDYRETVLDHARDLLKGQGGDDSWGVMHAALMHLTSGPGTPLYAEIFFRQNIRFQYPPSSLLALELLRLAGPDRVRIADGGDFGAWPAINDMIGWLFVLLTGVASALVLEIRLQQNPSFVDRRGLALVRGLLVIGLTLTFYPVVKPFTLGQIQVWINGLFALALLCWVLGRPATAGVLIGLTCLIKPHYGLLLAWALLRGEWRFLAAGSATAAAGLAMSIASFGLASHVEYLDVLGFLSRHGEAFYPNQSVNGLLNRLMALDDPQAYVVLDLPAGKFPPFNPWVWGLTLATSAGFIGFGLLRRSRRNDRARDFATMALCCTLASPIAWEHHYGILLPIFALLLAAPDCSPRRTVALLLAWLLAANFYSVATLLAATPLNPLLSHVFVAALIVLALLARRAGYADGTRTPDSASGR